MECAIAQAACETLDALFPSQQATQDFVLKGQAIALDEVVVAQPGKLTKQGGVFVAGGFHFNALPAFRGRFGTGGFEGVFKRRFTLPLLF